MASHWTPNWTPNTCSYLRPRSRRTRRASTFTRRGSHGLTERPGCFCPDPAVQAEPILRSSFLLARFNLLSQGCITCSGVDTARRVDVTGRRGESGWRMTGRIPGERNRVAVNGARRSSVSAEPLLPRGLVPDRGPTQCLRPIPVLLVALRLASQAAIGASRAPQTLPGGSGCLRRPPVGAARRAPARARRRVDRP